MHSYALPFMTTRHPRRLPALVMVAVGVLLFIVSQATPALAGSLYEGVYVVHYTAATVARYLMQPDGTMLLQDTVPAGRTPLSILSRRTTMWPIPHSMGFTCMRWGRSGS
jgi:hypothetical protein